MFMFVLFFRPRLYTLDEVVAMIEEDSVDDVRAVYIEPPDAHNLTDEDSDEDDGANINRLSGRQLQANAQIVYATENQENADENEDSNIEVQEIDENLEAVTLCLKEKLNNMKWRNAKDNFPNVPFFPEGSYERYRDFSAVELFELFFTDELFDIILVETHRYATSKNASDLNISKVELKVFFGILILSGYCTVPSRNLYWQEAKDVRCISVYESMRRDRFDTIMRYIHFGNNNEIDYGDKMFKLRPLISHLNAQFRKHFVPQQHLGFDEAMIKYFGSHGSKQFIAGKPIRFGYKVWSLNTPDGYLISFEIYQGRFIGNRPQQYDKLVGKCAAPLLHFIDQLPNKDLGFCFYFDNLFTSPMLLLELHRRGYRGTGTIRENRIAKSCTISRKKELEKQERGTCKFASDSTNNMLIVHWKDSKVVTIASNCHSIQPIGKCQRFSKSDHTRVGIDRPNVVHQYNKYMGGTDQMDQNVNAYRIHIRGKKWYFPIFSWSIDVALQNAWSLHRKAGGTLSGLEFRRRVSLAYLNLGTPAKKSGRATSNEDGTRGGEARFDGFRHFIQPTSENKRRRCVGQFCTSVVRSECAKCDVGLCMSCFSRYHTK